jgi:LysM repeat protein
MPRQPLRTLWALPALIAMPLAAVPLVMAQTAPPETTGGEPAARPRFDRTLDDLLRDGVVSPREVRTHEGLFPRSNDVRERPAPSSPAAAGRPAARPAPASAAAKSSPARVRVAGSEGSQDATSVADVAQKITVRIEGAGSSGSGVIVSRDGNNFYTVLTAWHSIGSTQPSEELIVITADKIRRRAITWKRIGKLDMGILVFFAELSKTYDVAKLEERGQAKVGSSVFVAGYVNDSDDLAKGYRFLKADIISMADQPTLEGYQMAYAGNDSTRLGMSGGPILLSSGQVVGIHGRRERDENSKASNTSLGIPVRLYLSAGVPSNSQGNLARSTEGSRDIHSTAAASTPAVSAPTLAVAPVERAAQSQNVDEIEISRRSLRPPQLPTTTTVVRLGDTLLKIAQRYGLTIGELLQLNPGLETPRLVVGSEVQVVRSAPVERAAQSTPAAVETPNQAKRTCELLNYQGKDLLPMECILSLRINNDGTSVYDVKWADGDQSAYVFWSNSSVAINPSKSSGTYSEDSGTVTIKLEDSFRIRVPNFSPVANVSPASQPAPPSPPPSLPAAPSPAALALAPAVAPAERPAQSQNVQEIEIPLRPSLPPPPPTTAVSTVVRLGDTLGVRFRSDSTSVVSKANKPQVSVLPQASWPRGCGYWLDDWKGNIIGWAPIGQSESPKENILLMNVDSKVREIPIRYRSEGGIMASDSGYYVEIQTLLWKQTGIETSESRATLKIKDASKSTNANLVVRAKSGC